MKRRVFLIWVARRSVGEGFFGVVALSSWGLSVIPEAGTGVVAEISWVEGLKELVVS